MKLSIISFTEKGILLSERIAELLHETEYALYTKCRDYGKERGTVQFVNQSIEKWAKEQFEERNTLLFIGACGIAVRAIAPHITDKLHDSPVLVIDERGQYVIPLLSGHVGGANEIAISIAILIGSTVGIGVLSAKIYRVGVLLYGMPPKFSNIMKTVFKKQ